MNQKEIGKFISLCRKEKGLTQMQLAEKLNITNRAVSKWETGKSVPDASIMLDLCEILDISVNELLSGERISMENYQKRADENMIEMKKQNEAVNKSARAGFGVSIFMLLVISFADVYKYGVEEAIVMPAFRTMIVVTLVWSFVYVFVMSKKK